MKARLRPGFLFVAVATTARLKHAPQAHRESNDADQLVRHGRGA